MRAILLALASIGLASAALAQQPTLEIALFDQDANLADAAKLKASVGAFVRELAASARFQPFSRLADLKSYLGEHDIQFAILSAGAAAGLKQWTLKPLLTPLRDGRATYTKVLVVPKGADLVRIKVVATTEVKFVAPERLTSRPLVLRVSKEIDALLGMTFGRADAAYVTTEALAQLGRFDPELAAKLEPVWQSPPLPNPQLYLVGRSVDPTLERRVVEGFLHMDKTPVGRGAMKALGYSGWRAP